MHQKKEACSPEKPNPKFFFKIEFIIFILFLVILLVSSIVYGPRIIGNFIATLVQHDNTSLEFTADGTHSYYFQYPPESIRVSGNLIGQGNARIYLFASNSRLLIAEVSNSQFNNENSFENVCIETCSLSDMPKYAVLDIEVENASLIINEITYDYSEKNLPNRAPVFSEIPDMQIAQGENAIINISRYSYDPDGDPITFLASSPDSISVFVFNDIVTLTPDSDFIGNATLQFIASDLNLSATSNIISIEVLPASNINTAIRGNITEKVIQYNAVINRPVRWKKIITLKEPLANITVNISSDAKNITVRKIVDNIAEDINDKTLIKEENITRLLSETSPPILGNIIRTLKNRVNIILGRAVQNLEDAIPEEVTELTILDNSTEFEIEYTTDAPMATEQNVSQGLKRITVSSEIPYTNILTFSELPFEAPKGSIKLYWLVNESEFIEYKNVLPSDDLLAGPQNELYMLDITDIPGFSIAYEDYDENSLIDLVEWITPHLSNQTFEIEINILNVQSYPTIGGEWTVAFTASGTANLTISAINSTSYAELNDDSPGTLDDLRILRLGCGNLTLLDTGSNSSSNVILILQDGALVPYNSSISQSLTIKSLLIPDFSCNDTSYLTVKVLTQGIHNQEFKFGEMAAYANNYAQYAPITDIIAFADMNITNTKYFI